MDCASHFEACGATCGVPLDRGDGLCIAFRGMRGDMRRAARRLLNRDCSMSAAAMITLSSSMSARCLSGCCPGDRSLTGRTVLVAGGAGAVGHAAIQLARWAGAEVIATVSGPVKAELARRAGAEHVINYRTQEPAAEIHKLAPHGVDIVVEVAPSQNAALNSAIVASGATIAIYANNGGDELTLPIRSHMTTNTRVQFVLIYGVDPEAKAH